MRQREPLESYSAPAGRFDRCILPFALEDPEVGKRIHRCDSELRMGRFREYWLTHNPASGSMLVS
jgi:hypothetical protein